MNQTFSLSLIQILEFVRDGDKTVTDLMDLGKQLLGRWACTVTVVTHLKIVFLLPSCTIMTPQCNIGIGNCLALTVNKDILVLVSLRVEA
jgi:hypothetical protein